jgi:hypothetical protein
MNSISYATNEIETLSFLSNDKSLNHITNLLIECEEQNAEKDDFSYSRNKQIDKIFALVRSSLLTS